MCEEGISLGWNCHSAGLGVSIGTAMSRSRSEQTTAPRGWSLAASPPARSPTRTCSSGAASCLVLSADHVP